jgi:hypothetical protein
VTVICAEQGAAAAAVDSWRPPAQPGPPAATATDYITCAEPGSAAARPVAAKEVQQQIMQYATQNLQDIQRQYGTAVMGQATSI